MFKRAFASAAFIATLSVVVAGSSSCSRSVDPVPLRTFERAQKLDVICVQVRDDVGNLVTPPKPAAASRCTSVPPGDVGDALPYHLFALVTQTARGEVAVVDLTAGRIVDVDHSTPGVNFLSVGTLPADVVSAPDGRISFVATAEPNKAAIYALPTAPPAATARESRGIFGDELGLAIPKITDWPACALPEPPSALSIIPRGADPALGYDVAVVLPGSGRTPTKVALMDPLPFLSGAGLETGPTRIEPGSLVPCPISNAIELTGDVPTSVSLGPAWQTGVPWASPSAQLPLPANVASCSAGVPVTPDGGITDAGVNDAAASDAATDAGSDASPTADGGAVVEIPKLPGDVPRAVNVVRDGQLLFLADEGLPLIHVLDFTNPNAPRELAPLVASSVPNPSRRVSVGQLAISPPTRDFKRYLYAVDRHDGSLMVFDVTDVASGGGSRAPMMRPHPELNPFQAVDRIAFSTPVTSVAFVRHDWPIFNDDRGQPLTSPLTGLLCNPNPNAGGADVPFRDPGAYYRNNVPGGRLDIGLGPLRLRGVFAFATLASGQMAIIDVDDWDAPCRRPDPMGVLARQETRTLPDGTTQTVNVETDETGGATPLGTPVFSAPGANNTIRANGVNDLAPLMPQPTSGDDLDPYHAPLAYYPITSTSYTSGTTNEAFFPVSAPHRARSLYLLRRDSTNGIHIPYLPTLASLRSKGSPINTVGPNALRNPMMLPTYSPLPDATQVKTPTESNPRSRELTKEQALLDTGHLPIESSVADVRFAWEEPQVHVDQDWTIAFEGALPGFDKLAANVDPEREGASMGYSTVSLTVPNGLMCSRGVMDRRVALERADTMLATYAKATFDTRAPLLSAPSRIAQRLGDYVQITDEILPREHPYWSAQEPADDACWEPQFSTADARYALCSRTFGAAADESLQRDFPIVEAYDDHLVIGRYGYVDPGNPEAETREVVGRDPSNAPFLKLMRCCFHRQVHFKVRAGAEWVATGSVSGYLHSMTTGAGGACVPSCRPEDALLNSRAPQVPRPLGIDLNERAPEGFTADEWQAQIPLRREALKAFIDRNSALALRNPIFAVVMWNELDIDTARGTRADASPVRGLEWAFSTRGQFSPLAINLAARTTVSIAPQTLRYIEPLRQLAVVDASNQGLQLYDLRTLAAVREPYL